MKLYILGLVFFGGLLSPSAVSVDQAIAQADIYYEPPPSNLGNRAIPSVLSASMSRAEVKMGSVQNLTNDRPIKVIVHGYMAHRSHSSINPLRKAYFRNRTDNVFVADWEAAASFRYSVSRRLVDRVGTHFADIISEFLTNQNLTAERLHLIGHSLGAHMVGIIGRHFNGTVGRVTGLDPALPLFSPDSKDSLRQGDGVFVDVIHTDSGELGDGTPRGHADFYPSYGVSPQPGCSKKDLHLKNSICSHIRAVHLYAESVNQPRKFPAIPCSRQEIQSGDVIRCVQELNSSDSTFMGEYVKLSARGQYFVGSAKTQSVYGKA